MENLGVDIKILIAQIINFGLFFFIFSKFIAQPFLGFIASEKKKDLEKQKLAEMNAKQQEEFLAKEKELRAQMREELDRAMKQAKIEAEEVKKDLIKDARAEADEIIEKARKQVKEEQLLIEKQLKEKVSSLSVLLVQHVLDDFLTDDMQKTVTDRLLTQLPKNNSIN